VTGAGAGAGAAGAGAAAAGADPELGATAPRLLEDRVEPDPEPVGADPLPAGTGM